MPNLDRDRRPRLATRPGIKDRKSRSGRRASADISEVDQLRTDLDRARMRAYRAEHESLADQITAERLAAKVELLEQRGAEDALTIARLLNTDRLTALRHSHAGENAGLARQLSTARQDIKQHEETIAGLTTQLGLREEKIADLLEDNTELRRKLLAQSSSERIKASSILTPDELRVVEANAYLMLDHLRVNGMSQRDIDTLLESARKKLRDALRQRRNNSVNKANGK